MAKYNSDLQTNNTDLRSILDKIKKLPVAKPEQSKTVEITQNGDVTILPDNGKVLSQVVAKVNVSGSKENVVPKNVNFYDYDGTLCYAYTLSEMQSLNQLPKAPSHKGLVFQEWNWTLPEIKAMGRDVDVGANYITDDGATRLYIELQPEALSPYICLGVAGTVTVDWGDGTPIDTLTGSDDHTLVKKQHFYSAAGQYVISIKVTSGNIAVRPDDYYGNILRSTSIAYPSMSYDYRYLNTIQKIEFGTGIELKDSAFRECDSVKSISLPANVFNRTDTYIFRNCGSLECIVFPRSAVSIYSNPIGDSTYLKKAILPGNCTDSINSYTFSGCTAMRTLILPDTVITIAHHAFDYCNSLISIVIPNGVTAIEDKAFRNCYSMKYIDFTRCTTIPTFGIEVFDFTPPDMEIRVPKNNVAAWKATTNLSVYADKIVGV